MIVVGIDAGGTSSRLRAVQDGSVLINASSGPANWASTPRETLIAGLGELLGQVPSADVVFAGMAGVLTRNDRDEVTAVIQSFGAYKEVVVAADYVPAWRACDSEVAVLTIAGTGSNVCARRSREFVRAGIGGSLISDRGSGFGFGRSLLNAALNEGATTILDAAIEFAKTAERDEIVAHFYRNPAPVARIAEFATYCLSAIPHDRDVDRLLQVEMQALASQAQCIGTKVEGPIYFRTGGFWNAAPDVVRYFEKALGAATHVPNMSPLDGAVLVAQEAITP